MLKQYTHDSSGHSNECHGEGLELFKIAKSVGILAGFKALSFDDLPNDRIHIRSLPIPVTIILGIDRQ